MSTARRPPPFVISSYQSPYDYGVYQFMGYAPFKWPPLVYTANELVDIGKAPTAAQTDSGEQIVNIGAPIVNIQSPINLTNPTPQSGSAAVLDTAILPDVTASNLERTYFMIQASNANDETLFLGLGGPGNLEILPGADFTPSGAWPQNSVWIRRSNLATGVGNYTIVQALAVKKGN